MQEGFSFCCLLPLAGCERPGEGVNAAAGFAAAEPVTEALGRFNTENRVYPETFADLVPSYLSEVPGEVNGFSLNYRATDAGRSFKLAFSYSGPGMKGCRYRPETVWACNGSY